mgnify:CR=1 FL=1
MSGFFSYCHEQYFSEENLENRSAHDESSIETIGNVQKKYSLMLCCCVVQHSSISKSFLYITMPYPNEWMNSRVYIEEDDNVQERMF